MNKNVMVVDDDESVLRATELVLRRAGCNVVAVLGGEACLRRLREGFSGVILMDIMMPKLNGWQTIRSIISENMVESVLICMLTAKPFPGDEANGLEGFVFDYLPKPFDNVALLRCVENAASFLPD